MLAKVPAISKVIIPFNKLNLFSFAQAQLIEATSFKIIYGNLSACVDLVFCVADKEDIIFALNERWDPDAVSPALLRLLRDCVEETYEQLRAPAPVKPS